MNSWERQRLYDRIHSVVLHAAGAILWVLVVWALIKYLGGL